MSNRIQIVLAAALWLLLAGMAMAADIKVNASLNRAKIALNEQFELSVEVTGGDARQADDPEVPDLSTFAAYSGNSMSQNFQFINGKMQYSKTYTYYFVALQVGSFEVPPVIVEFKGQNFQSKPLKIEIFKSKAQPQPKTPGNISRTRPARPSENISENLFLKAVFNRTRVYQNEAIIVSYKLYTMLTVTNFRLVSQPNFGNFWAEEIPIARQVPTSEEYVNGKRFVVATIRKIALFPTGAGPKVIPAMRVEVDVRTRKRRKSRDIFDAFFDDPFGRVATYSLSTKERTIQVLPLPAEGRPRDFSGAVGQFSIKATTDRTRTKSNEAITLKVTLQGTGNIKTLSPPRIEFPREFEVYDPKVTEHVNRNSTTITGSKTFEYVLIPREPGNYVLDNIRYTYFNPRQGAYRITRSPVIHLAVSKSDKIASATGSGLSREEVRLLGKDIRYIAKSADTFVAVGKEFYHLPALWAMLISPLFVLVGAMLYRNHRDRLSSNQAYARSRKAQKFAQKQLQAAKQAMDRDDVAGFYAETSKALTAYVGNKLNLAESTMVREDLARVLGKRGAPKGLVEHYYNLLAECDYRRFAVPDAPGDAMAKAYVRAKNLLTSLEKVL